MNIVKWSAQALADLEAIKNYISHDSPNYANIFVSKIITKGDNLAIFPKSGREVPEADLEFVKEVFEGNYRIVYSYESNIINIITIHHGAKELKLFE